MEPTQAWVFPWPKTVKAANGMLPHVQRTPLESWMSESQKLLAQNFIPPMDFWSWRKMATEKEEVADELCCVWWWPAAAGMALTASQLRLVGSEAGGG